MRGFLKKKHTTKAERVFAEHLKRNKIQYNTKVQIMGFEVDFLIGKYAIEINGHPANYEKSRLLKDLGFTPVNYSNKEVLNNSDIITKLYGTR